MSSNKLKEMDPRKTLEKIFGLAHGTDAEIDRMNADQLRQELRQSGINTDKGWRDLQAMIKVAQGKVRMSEAKAKRRQIGAASQVASFVHETKEALIEQIRGLISLSGSSAVYARKWEESSIEDLRSVRDELARTAARAAAKKKDEKR